MTYALILAGALLVPTSPSPSVVPLFGLFDREPRLQQRLTLTGVNRPFGEIVADLRRQTRVDLEVQADLYARPTTVQVRTPRRARELLSMLASVSAGTWIKRGAMYLLLRDPDTARVAKNYALWQRAPLDRQEMLTALTPEQRQTLRIRGKLTFADLGPVQRRWLLIVMAHEFWQHPERHLQHIMHGRGAEIQYKDGRAVFCGSTLDERGEVTVRPFAWAPLP